MYRKRVLVLLAAFTLTVATAGPGPHSSPVADIRLQARSLADDWVRTASVANLNDLALRTSAFAGLMRGNVIQIDTRRMDTNQVLLDSAKTILGEKTALEDSQAVRNIVYALEEVARGNSY